MAKNKVGGGTRMIEGAILGIALGVAAGMYLASGTTKELKGELAKKYGEFTKFMAPKLKKLKKVGREEYDVIVDKAMVGFEKLYNITKKEALVLAKAAKRQFENISKNS